MAADTLQDDGSDLDDNSLDVTPFEKQIPTGNPHPKSQTPEELAASETAGDQSTGTAAESSEAQALGASSEAVASKNEIPFRPEKKRFFKAQGTKNKKSNRKKLLWLLGGGSGVAAFAVVVIIIFGLLGSLKYVHFATVLRTVAFARFTGLMQQEYAQTIFDTAVLDPASTGNFSRDLLGDRSIFDIIRGVNPEQQLIDLGRAAKAGEPGVEFNFSQNRNWLGRTNSSFEGITITDGAGGGKFYSLDGYAQDLVKARTGTTGPVDATYDSLGIFDKLKVRAQLSSDVRGALSDDLSISGRDLVASLKGIQAAFGFKLVGFANAARDFLGKSTTAADAEAAKESFESTEGSNIGPAADSLNSDANSDIQKTLDDTQKKLDNGEIPSIDTEITNNSNVSGVAGAAEDAKQAAGLVLIATLYCTLRDLHNSAPKIDKANQEHAVRYAALIQSRKDQIKAGDVTAEAVGGATDTTFSDTDQSSLYANDTGQSVSGDPADVQNLTSVNSSNIFTQGPVNTAYNVINTYVNSGLNYVPIVKNGVNALDNQLCSILLQPGTQITLAAIGIIIAIGSGGTGDAVAQTLTEAFTNGLQEILTFNGAKELALEGGKFALTYATFNYAGKALESFIKNMSGLDYSGIGQGPDAYNQAWVGTHYLAASTDRMTGAGRPLSTSEAAQAQVVAMDNLQQQYNKSGVYNRYFAVNNPFSLMGSVIAGIPTSLTTFASSISSGIPNLFSKIGSFLATPSWLLSIIGHKQIALAAASDSVAQQHNNFGVQQWGWSTAEMQRIETDPNFSLVDNARYVEANYKSLKDDYNDCFRSAFQNIPGDSSTTPAKCTAGYLSTDRALHWRKYQLDKYTATQLSTNPFGASTP